MQPPVNPGVFRWGGCPGRGNALRVFARAQVIAQVFARLGEFGLPIKLLNFLRAHGGKHLVGGGGAPCPPTRLLRARWTAVPVATITTTTQQKHLPALGPAADNKTKRVHPPRRCTNGPLGPAPSGPLCVESPGDLRL